MHVVAKAVSTLALLATALVPVLYYTGSVSEPGLKNCMLASALLWFLSAPWWMRPQERS